MGFSVTSITGRLPYARPKCADPDVDTTAHVETFDTDEMVAAGIRYIGDLVDVEREARDLFESARAYFRLAV